MLLSTVEDMEATEVLIEGSLTGAVASERVSEAPKVSLIMDGNH